MPELGEDYRVEETGVQLRNLIEKQAFYGRKLEPESVKVGEGKN